MPFFFANHPSVSYDVQKNGVPNIVQNPLVRFKLQQVLENRSALYYTHNLQEGQSLQFIAKRYYNDVTLDWIIYIINDIVHSRINFVGINFVIRLHFKLRDKLFFFYWIISIFYIIIYV